MGPVLGGSVVNDLELGGNFDPVAIGIGDENKQVVAGSMAARAPDQPTGIPGIIQYRRISPPDPQVFTGLDLSTVRQRCWQTWHWKKATKGSLKPSNYGFDLIREMLWQTA